MATGGMKGMNSCSIAAADRADQSMVSYVLFNPYQQVSGERASHRYFGGHGQPADTGVLTRTGPDRIQLHMRDFQAAPDYGNGVFLPDAESYLQNGIDTRFIMSCGKYAEHDYNRFVPFNVCMNAFICHEKDFAQSVDQKVGQSTRPEGKTLSSA